tara:strand:- start:1400 stop:2470 length:1071 start_codon:yes stop_codon:yes gene_type:complete
MKNLILTFFTTICFLNVQAQCTADFTYVQNGPTTYFTDLSFITQGWSTNYSVSYLWDFGDGNTSTLQNPSHTYSNGLYSPCLTVTYFDSVIMNFCTSIYCDSILIGNGPNASWDCGLMGCFDPGTGNGQYSSLAACQAACTVTPSWDCNPNALGCYDPGTGLGQYTTLAACQAACSVTPSWNCGPTGCYDPGTGMGTYTSLASCQSACIINSSSLCDSIVVTGSQTQLTMQVNNFNSFIYHWISIAPDGTVLGEDSMWNNHTVYNSSTIPYDTITTCITYPDAGTLVTCCIDFIWDATTGLWAKMGMQTTINEIKGERKLIKIVDILGKTTTKHFKSNQILFYIYDDGSTEKIYSE